MFVLTLSEEAMDDLKVLKKSEQVVITDAIEQQLPHQPLVATRNRKPLRPNDLFQWELRVDRFRVFYDVDEPANVVLVKAIGWKEHNVLFIRGQEFKL